MSNIVGIYIPFVEAGITSEYIMNAFENSNIATISSITLIPNTNPSKYSLAMHAKAFIAIEEWHDTESAYTFIKSLQDSTNETRLVHSEDSWWLVKINEKQWITTMELFEQYKTFNELLYTKMNDLICKILTTSFKIAKKNMRCELISKLKEDQEWKDIEQSLFAEKSYQQLEDDLCL